MTKHGQLIDAYEETKSSSDTPVVPIEAVYCYRIKIKTKELRLLSISDRIRNMLSLLIRHLGLEGTFSRWASFSL